MQYGQDKCWNKCNSYSIMYMWLVCMYMYSSPSLLPLSLSSPSLPHSLPPSSLSMHPLVVLILLLAMTFWLQRLYQAGRRFIHFWEIRTFYHDALGISTVSHHMLCMYMYTYMYCTCGSLCTAGSSVLMKRFF